MACAALRWRFSNRLGFARAPRQFVDDVLRQARRHASPGRRQKVDEELFAGRHGVDGHALRQRDANGLAVGIAPRRADIVGRLFRDAIDRHVERLLEADDQHIAGIGARSRRYIRSRVNTIRA